MIYDEYMEISSLLDEAQSYLTAIEKLQCIQHAYTTYGWTASLEALYGKTFQEYSIEATAGGVAKAIGSGLLKFAKALGAIVTKIINMTVNFFSKNRKSQLNDMDAIKSKISSIQDETIDVNAYAAKNMVNCANIISTHFKLPHDPSMDFGNAAEIDAVRAAYLNKFNSQLRKEAQVGNDYKTSFKLPKISGKRIKQYGFVNYDVFVQVDKAIMGAIAEGQGVINNLKSSETDVAKLVKRMENNQFSNDGGDTTKLQGVFVYARIIFNDIARLKALNGMFGNVVSAIRKVANGYVSSTAQAEGVPESTDTPDNQNTDENNEEQK